jgi:hypothetical protein
MTKNLLAHWKNISLFFSLAAIAPFAPFGTVEQEAKGIAPQVLSIGVPYYPAVARAAHVEGVVHIEVATNGETVAAARIADGHKLLATFAESNARTWTFVKHEPTKFILTYHYKLVGHLEHNKGYSEVVLRLPDEVEISAVPLVLSDPAPDTH